MLYAFKICQFSQIAQVSGVISEATVYAVLKPFPQTAVAVQYTFDHEEIHAATHIAPEMIVGQRSRCMDSVYSFIVRRTDALLSFVVIKAYWQYTHQRPVAIGVFTFPAA